ncbi:putative RNA-binding protein [Trypanosoma rangeli]|uniref:Putative RNA-binding protein n=1 Tax=Trypanosoma rangeli TaxID=5698 RepID=A0A3S5IQY0_TRYRA|nr:putative RNA-binding protein [Trypanosoma rangeli]RNF03090.1 putative RNA-binding protein [Trypanosoma rangeli]|eukprot:RNF03090.1 putative RNA-binding protein [Trypanosoma rangeli]
MYEQDTCFRAANTPLFVQLFGPSCTPPPHSRARESLCLPLATCTRPHEGVRHRAINPPPVPVSLPDSDESGTAAAGVVPGGDAVTVESHADATVNDAVFERDNTDTSEKPKLPFRQVMRELERRFQEQMEVHRGLQASMQQVDLLRDEVSLFRAERRTAALASALSRQSMSLMEPAVAASMPAAPAPPRLSKSSGAAIAASPLLEKILKSYAEERSSKVPQVEEAKPSKAENTRRRLPVDVIRPPEEPRPYARVYYVPVAKPQENAYSEAVVSASTLLTSANSASTSALYTEDFEASAGVSTDLSVASGFSNSSVATSSMSVTSSTSIRQSASDSVSTVTTMTESSVIDRVNNSGVRGSSGDDMSLLTVLQEFYNVCGSANRLVHALLGTDGNAERVQLRDEGAVALGMKSVTDAKDEDGRQVWLSSLRRDVGDVRKLRRFIDHMKKNMRSLDCQRKAQEAKRRLLVNAQRLARAHQRMRHNKSTLSDVMDGIVDLLGSEASRSGEETVMDEVAIDSALRWDGVSDEVVEDDVVDVASSSDVMDDAVVDELDGLGEWGNSRLGDDDDVDVPQEVGSELSWAVAESEYANALAEASDVGDMVKDEVPLPSDEEEAGEVDEDLTPLPLDVASSVPEVVDDVANSDSDVAAEEAQGESLAASFQDEDVDDDVPDASLLGDATSQDADVSSVFPASTTTLSSVPANNQARDDEEYNHEGTDSAESALDALEHDLRETESRRVKALLSVHPTLFTSLYAAEEVSPTPTGSSHDAAEQTPNGEDVGPEATVVQPAESEVRPACAVSLVCDEVVEATIELPRESAVSGYAADDIVAQLQWKERQLALLRQLRRKTAWEQERDEEEGNEDKTATAAQLSMPVEEKADYHWGMLETLLQCRFGTTGNEGPDEDMLADSVNESSWTDAYDDTAAYTSSDVEFSAGSEASLQTA